MCRALLEGGRRCPCEAPEARRVRQKLAYHVSKAAGGDVAVLIPSPPTKEQNSPEVDVNQVTPETIKALANSFNEQITSSKNSLEFFLDGAELNVDTLKEAIRERERQVLHIGSLVASRAEQIAGFTADEAYDRHRARIDDLQAKFDELQVKRKEAEKIQDKERSVIRNRYPEQTPREKFSPEDQEEWNNISRRYMKVADLSSDARADLSHAVEGTDPESIADLRKLSEANLAALKEIREFGGAITVASNSSKNGVKVLQEDVAPVMPSDWIASSNKGIPMRIKDTTGRAHYSSWKTQTKNIRKPASINEVKPKKWEPDLKDDRYKEWRKVEGKSSPWGNTWEHPEYEENESSYYEVGGQMPPGRNWEAMTIERDGEYVQRWVRKKYVTVKEEGAIQPELLIPKHNPALTAEERYRQIATGRHEFAHRVEAVKPHIPTLEESFLARRTTFENGRREPLTRYSSSSSKKKEYVREDNFVTAYMGKEYEDGSHREVLSTGTEAVFSGRYGGLIGIGQKRKDHDMRNFILGLYASA